MECSVSSEVTKNGIEHIVGSFKEWDVANSGMQAACSLKEESEFCDNCVSWLCSLSEILSFDSTDISVQQEFKNRLDNCRSKLYCLKGTDNWVQAVSGFNDRKEREFVHY